MQVDEDVGIFSGSISNIAKDLGFWVCLFLPGSVGLQ